MARLPLAPDASAAGRWTCAATAVTVAVVPPEKTPAIPVFSRLRWQTLTAFVVAATLYFLARTPALDEWDSIQFAQGVGDFNLWRHQPHPPGYPLYILAGWLGTHLLGLDVPTALQLASALGGGLFVACWFALGAEAFGRFVGAVCAVALGTLLITWMTATKTLADAPGAGLIALTLLLTSRRQPIVAALAAAAAVGVRPQIFPVAALLVGLAAARSRLPRRWLTVLGAFLGGCLLWLLPTMALQAMTPESGGNFLAYPTQLLAQWRWRLDQSKAFVGADPHGESFLIYRLDHHLLGLLTRGCGFSLVSVWGWLGLGLLVAGWTFYALRRWDSSASPPSHRAFWSLQLPWAALHAAVVFCCLPGDQRYYLPIFPLLLLPALVGWANIRPPPHGRWLALTVPVATLLATLPFVAENHREPAPPVRLLRFLQAQYPPAERPGVHLLLRDSFRHAQWYAPEFNLQSTALPRPADAPLDPTVTPLYTDDPALAAAAPDHWRSVVSFRRSVLIYRKHHEVTLYRCVLPGKPTLPDR